MLQDVGLLHAERTMKLQVFPNCVSSAEATQNLSKLFAEEIKRPTTMRLIVDLRLWVGHFSSHGCSFRKNLTFILCDNQSINYAKIVFKFLRILCNIFFEKFRLIISLCFWSTTNKTIVYPVKLQTIN